MDSPESSSTFSRSTDVCVQTELTADITAIQTNLGETKLKMHDPKRKNEDKAVGTEEWFQNSHGKTIFFSGLQKFNLVLILFSF